MLSAGLRRNEIEARLVEGAMRRTLGVAAAVLAIAALSGCMQTRPATRPIDTHSDEADCGVHDVKQAAHLPDGAAQCVVDAVAKGNRGRMTVTRPTTEGDPITTVYSVQRDKTVIVSADTTQDRFGNQGVVREKCTGPYAKDGELLFEHCEPDR